MTAPTIKSTVQTAWNTTTTPKTLSLTVATGDYIGVIALSEAQFSTNQITVSGTGVDAWVRQQQGTDTTGNSCCATAFTAKATTTGTLSVSVADSSTQNFGAIAWVIDGTTSDGYDSSAKQQVTSGSAAANWSHTTVAANCFIASGTADWNASSITGRTWETINGDTPTAANSEENVATQVGVNYTVLAAHWGDAGAAGAKTVGLSAPTATYRPSSVSLAFKGKAASGSTASGSLTLSGSAVASTSASGSLSLSGTATESSVATGALALSGSGAGGPTASGSLSLSGTATHKESSSGSITLGGSQGTDTVISQPSGAGGNYTFNGSFLDQLAQTFTATANMNVFKATAGLAKTGSPTDNWYFTIAPDSSGAPGTVIGTSDNVASSSISGTVSDVIFNFTTQVGLASGTVYWLILNRSGASDGTNTVNWYYQSSNPYAGGAAYTKSGSTWTAQTGDMEFSVSGHQVTGPSASGALSLSGSEVASFAATGSVTLSATATESSVATASLSLAGTGTSSGAASGSITLAGSSAWSTSASGAVTLSGSASAIANATGSGSVSLSGIQSTGPSGAGSITLGGTTTRASDVASGSLSLVGSTFAASSASGSVTLTATGAWRQPASASITLAGTATRGSDSATGAVSLVGSGNTGGNSATGAIALAGTGTVRQVAAGSVTLSGSGAWQVTVTGSVTLAGTGGATARATATGTLSLTGTAFVGVVKNYIHGGASVGRGGGATVKSSGGASIGSKSGGASIP